MPNTTTTIEPTCIKVDIDGAEVEVLHLPGEGVFVRGIDAPGAQLIALQEAVTILLYPIVEDTSED